MTHAAEHAIEGPPLKRTVAPRHPRWQPRCRDARWPELAATLCALRAEKRCSVRIVDAECGAGTLLLHAVRFARALGFTAIEARGIGDAPALVGRARAAASQLRDPAIGITFERGEPIAALGEESDFPADIVLWHGGRSAAAARAALRAGRALITDRPPCASIAA